MKTLLLTVLILMALFGCQERVKKIETSGSSDSLGSEIYQKSKINFESNPIAEPSRTILSEKYNELDSNFATYYIIVTWGCGSGCVTGAMVDYRDGFIYSMPEDKDWGGNGTYIESKKESTVLITVAVVQSPSGEVQETRKYWEWDENLRTFNFVKIETVLLDTKE